MWLEINLDVIALKLLKKIKKICHLSPLIECQLPEGRYLILPIFFTTVANTPGYLPKCLLPSPFLLLLSLSTLFSLLPSFFSSFLPTFLLFFPPFLLFLLTDLKVCWGWQYALLKYTFAQLPLQSGVAKWWAVNRRSWVGLQEMFFKGNDSSDSLSLAFCPLPFFIPGMWTCFLEMLLPSCSHGNKSCTLYWKHSRPAEGTWTWMTSWSSFMSPRLWTPLYVRSRTPPPNLVKPLFLDYLLHQLTTVLRRTSLNPQLLKWSPP